MKRIKMALTAVAVIGIVGGALAFKAKPFGGQFCASPTINSNCKVVNGVTETGGTLPFFKDATWDGIPGHCRAAACPTATLFAIEQ